ncbi:MAG: dienelactone hydrolase family protein [Candidatus Phaeomarinobacter sp.]
MRSVAMDKKTTGMFAAPTATILAAAALTVSFAVTPSMARELDGGPQEEIDRTWTKGLVYLPDGQGGQTRQTIGDFEAGGFSLPDGVGPTLPVIVQLHGCDGIGSVPKRSAMIFSSQGYAVFLPDSFAREYKPTSCNPLIPRGSLHREVLGWRQAEADNALSRAKDIPWVQKDNIFMAGHSEGAITAATYVGQPVAGRVIEGWPCHAGWEEYIGLNSPKDEPVLSLYGENDPWFPDAIFDGDCGDFMGEHTKGTSVVYRSPDRLHDDHYLLYVKKVQDVVFAFLGEHTTPQE